MTYTYQKKKSRKWIIAILFITTISIATLAALYVTLPPVVVEVGVKVGDTFTYSIKGSVTLTGANATMDPGFEQYNQTDYYKVTITGVNGTQVSMFNQWVFKNGTTVDYTQTIDIANGAKTDKDGFWAIYPANLRVGSLLRPTGYDGQTVNNTDTARYTSGQRSRCYWFINNVFYDLINDPSYGTARYDYMNIFFDRETGMLTSLTNFQVYNNPAKTQVIYWNLIDTNVWKV